MRVARVSRSLKLLRFPALLVGLFLLVGSVAAQANYQVAISSATTQANDTQLALRLNFTVQDSSGRVARDATPSRATIHLEDGGVYPALLTQAEANLYAVLLMDTSGSMGVMANELRAAALEAVAAAPEGTRFAVLTFADALSMAVDFTANRGEVENAIAGVDIGSGSTCLIDAAITAVQSLQQVAGSNAQRAVFLLADGRDELISGEGTRCSQNTVEDLVALSQSGDTPVPIHVAALSNSTLPLDLDVLEVLSGAAGSLTIAGEDADLSAYYRDVMAELTAEWQAQANVYTSAGQHGAALFVTLASGEQATPDTTTFFAPRNFDRPAGASAAMAVGITDFRYDRENDELSMTIDLTNPRDVGELRVEVWNRQTNERVTDFFFDPGSRRQQTVSLDTEALTANGIYSVRVVPLDHAEVEFLDAGGRIVLAEHPFQYVPDPQMVFETNAVRVSPEQGLLVVDLNVRNAPEISRFSGRYIDQEDNTEAASFGPVERVGNMVFLEVPEESGSYQLIVNGQDAEGNTLATTSYDFRYSRPTVDEVSMAWQALQGSTVLWVGGLLLLALVMILEALVLWALFRFRMRRELDRLRAELAAAGPAPTPVTTISRRKDEGARVLVVHTLNPHFQGREMEIKAVPFLIGREDCALTITGDRQISREHVSINLKDGQYTLTDLRSSNGTYLDDVRLNPNEEVPLHPDALIRLGQVTQLRFVHEAAPAAARSENGSDEALLEDAESAPDTLPA